MGRSEDYLKHHKATHHEVYCDKCNYVIGECLGSGIVDEFPFEASLAVLLTPARIRSYNGRKDFFEYDLCGKCYKELNIHEYIDEYIHKGEK